MATGGENDIRAEEAQYVNGLASAVLLSEGWLSAVPGKKILLKFDTIKAGPEPSQIVLAITKDNLMAVIAFLPKCLAMFDLPAGN